VSIDQREGALQLFAKKDRLRKQARANGMCTRCVVRSAPRGKAYCQRCTDYAKQYARQRNAHRKAVETGGYDRYRDKVMRIADYGSARDLSEQPHARTEPEPQRYVDEIAQGPLPHRRDEQFADLARARASGAAVILNSPIPIPLGLNPFYDDV
jgi:predicted Rossmann-fold nucleotide-binding protein